MALDTKTPLKILVVDDHEVARTGLANLLTTPQIEVSGVLSNGADANAKLKEVSFDLVLLDVRMPQMDGLATLAQIRAEYPELPVVMLSTYDNPTYIARAAALGATDYIFKTTAHVSISAVLRHLASGQPPHPNSELVQVQKKMHDEVDRSKLPEGMALTTREAQVLRHISLGLSNKEIARSLKISVETVKEHVQNVLRKMKANDRTDAAVRGVRMGLLD